MSIIYSEQKELPEDLVIALYKALEWASADKPQQLMAGLKGSHTVISAWDGDRLIGLGNAISDGALVVYYPHLIVHPDYQKCGIGRSIVERMMVKYADYHQQSIIADGSAVEFYKKCGFKTSGSCEAVWIYDGHDHD